MPQSVLARKVCSLYLALLAATGVTLVFFAFALTVGLHPLGWIALAAVIVAVFAAGGRFVLARIFKPFDELVAQFGPTNLPIGGDPLTPQDEIEYLADQFLQMRERMTSGEGESQEMTQRLQTVLGSMSEGVVAVTRDRAVLFANSASRKMLEFPRGEPVGRPFLELTRNRAIVDAANEAVTQGIDIERDLEIMGVPRRYLALRAAPLPGDPCPGVVLVMRDVTELRRLENLRREFVANVGHELKTPLAAVKAYAETLRLGAINDPEHNVAFVIRIEEQAERLHQLILDILQIARIETGKEVFDIVDVPLKEVFEETEAIFADAAAAKQIRLNVQIPDFETTVRGDEEGVRTILSNLVDNAIKYTPAQGEVIVRCEVNDEEVILSVQDSGIGIAERDMARIFERFYRVDKARSREVGGTGLGLSIVKHLTQSFGGQVSVRSELEKGTTFSVTLLRK